MRVNVHKAQMGFAVVLVIIAVAVIGSSGAIAFAKVRQSQNNKIALEKQQLAEKQAAEALAQTEQNKSDKQDQSSTDVEQPVQDTPQPSPEPVTNQQARPTIIRPTQANCLPNDGKFTVYGAVKEEAPTYFDSDRTSKSPITISYRAAVQVHCFSNSIQKLVYDDYFVAPESVSTTKP